MIVKNLSYITAALFVVTLCACQKEPSTSDLHRDFLVYTSYDTDATFDAYATYFLPDSILIIGNKSQSEYWNDLDAQEIIATVAAGLDAAGYIRSYDKEAADLGIQLSYVRRVTYFVGYNNPYWWWYYPYYWAPDYWGNWTGWHYPYEVYYGYTAGSLLTEMVDLEADQVTSRKLPVIWNSYIGGLLTSSTDLNLERTIAALQQAFAQSPYLRAAE